MIRQAISCDICGAEKKQTNHWFVASEQAGELRVSGWSSRMRLRAGTKHLCGQTCLHKLVDEFMARTIAGRVPSPAVEPALPANAQRDTGASLTSETVYLEPGPAAHLVAKSTPPLRPMLAAAAIVVPMHPRPPVDEPRPLPPAPRIDESPNYTSRRWHAEAWERERERELHAVERRSENVPRHRKTF